MASRENINTSPLASGLKSERLDPKFSDVTVRVEGTDYPCHKVILGRTSEYFMGLFQSEMQEALEDRVTLEEITCDIFEKLLNWLYHGDISIDGENVFDIILAANRLQIETLLLKGKVFLMNNLSAGNCGRAYNISQIRQWKFLEKAAWDILVAEFDAVGMSELDVLSAGDMKALVSNPELVTRSEDLVVDKVLKWVSRGQDSSNVDGDESDVPQEEPRQKYLPELLKACRYLLVSFTFYWETLNEHPLLQRDHSCQALLQEILRYKTQLDSHQYGCPSAAVHRDKSSRVNVLMNVFTSKTIHFQKVTKLDEDWKTFKLSFPTNLGKLSAVSALGGLIYFLEDTTSKLYAYDTNTNGTMCCTSTSEAGVRILATLPVDSALIVIRSCDDSRHTIQRIHLPCYNAKWEEIGSLLTRGKDFVCATNIGSKLISFWKDTDPEDFVMECFDLVRRSSFTFCHKLTSSKTAVPLKKREDTFLLQGNGQLWRLKSRDKAPYVEFEKLKALWTGEQELRAATITIDTLTVFRTEPDPRISVQWCEPIGVAGVYSLKNVIGIAGDTAGFISVVVDKETTLS